MGLLSRTLKELVDLGYPESVAKRIVSGELPMDTASRMARAKKQGFNKDSFHYSRNGEDIKEIREGNLNLSLFDSLGIHTGSKDAAAKRAASTRSLDPNTGRLIEPSGPTYPFKIKHQKPLLNKDGNPYTESELHSVFAKMAEDKDYGDVWDIDVKDKLRSDLWDDYDVIPYINEVEDAGNVSYISPPSAVRSKYAAFDPAKSGSSNILASNPVATTGAGLLGLAAMTNSDDADAGVLSKAKGLLMDTPSRMARAKEQGFDVDTPYYHGTNVEFDSFGVGGVDVAGKHGNIHGVGVNLTRDKDLASSYARTSANDYGGEPVLREVRTKGRIFDARSNDVISDTDADNLSKYINDNLHSGDIAKIALDAGGKKKTVYIDNEKELDDFYDNQMKNWEYFSGFDRTMPEFVDAKNGAFGVEYVDFNAPLDFKGLPKSSVYNAIQRSGGGNITDVFKGSGYGGIEVHNQQTIFDTSNIRSPDAQFDPAKTGSSNLLASRVAPTATAGLLGLTALAPDDARAAEIAATDMRKDTIQNIPQAYSNRIATGLADLLGGDQPTRNRRAQSLQDLLDWTPVGGVDALQEGKWQRQQGNVAEGLLNSVLGAAEFVPAIGPVIGKGRKVAKGLFDYARVPD